MDKPVDYICIPVILSPGKSVDMWLRADEVMAFQPAPANPMGVRSYVRSKHSSELIPTSESCTELLAQLRGEEVQQSANVVLFPGDGRVRLPTMKHPGAFNFDDLFKIVRDDVPPDDTTPPPPLDPNNPKEPA